MERVLLSDSSSQHSQHHRIQSNVEMKIMDLPTNVQLSIDEQSFEYQPLNTLLLSSLQAHVWYDLRVSAYSDAGQTDAEYSFYTGPGTGALGSNSGGARLRSISMISALNGRSLWQLLAEPQMFLPLSACALLICALGALLCGMLTGRFGIRNVGFPTGSIITNNSAVACVANNNTNGLLTGNSSLHLPGIDCSGAKGAVKSTQFLQFAGLPPPMDCAALLGGDLVCGGSLGGYTNATTAPFGNTINTLGEKSLGIMGNNSCTASVSQSGSTASSAAGSCSNSGPGSNQHSPVIKALHSCTLPSGSTVLGNGGISNVSYPCPYACLPLETQCQYATIKRAGRLAPQRNTITMDNVYDYPGNFSKYLYILMTKKYKLKLNKNFYLK